MVIYIKGWEQHELLEHSLVIFALIGCLWFCFSDYVILQAPLYVHEGDNVTLKCHHYPTYSGGQTIFYKDNTVIRDWGSDPELHIYNINLAGSKGYKCTKKVSNYEYSVEASIPMKGKSCNMIWVEWCRFDLLKC